MKRVDSNNNIRGSARRNKRSSSKHSPPHKRHVKPGHRSHKPSKRVAKEGAGGLPACASRKYKYYNAGGHHSPIPSRSRDQDHPTHIPRGHGGVYDSVYVTNVKAADLNKRDDHNQRISPDANYHLSPGDSHRFKKSPHPLYKINPNVPHSSHSSSHRRHRSHSKPHHSKPEKRRRQMRRTNSEPNIRVLYRHDEAEEDGFWVRLKRSQSDLDISKNIPILRKSQAPFKPNDDYLDMTARDNLRNSKIRFDNFFSRVTFIMEDPYTTILCVEETLPLEFSDETEESTSSEMTSYSASQEMVKYAEDDLPQTLYPQDDLGTAAACSCVIS